MKRKEFIYKTGATALLLSLGVNLVGCSDDELNGVTPTPPNQGNNNNDDDDDGISFELTESPFDVLRNTDSWLLHPEENILLANVNDDILAFSSVCPHSGCSRNWSFESLNFVCGCHGSTFTNEGDLVKGPATSGLIQLEVEVDGNTITIKT